MKSRQLIKAEQIKKKTVTKTRIIIQEITAL